MSTPSLQVIDRLPDEPPIWLLHCWAPCETCGAQITGVGVGFSEPAASIRAQGEQVERMALHVASEHCDLPIWDSEIGLGAAAVPLSSFAGRPDRTPLPEASTPRSWWPARRLADGAVRYLPVEAAVLRFPERALPPIREPLTTGTAAHTTTARAAAAAERELIERDAYMRLVLGHDPVVRVALPDSLQESVVDWSSRYRLEIILFRLGAESVHEVALALLIDHTGRGPAVTAGLGCSENFAEAAQAAALEAWQPRVWLRSEHDLQPRSPEPDQIRTALDRGLYWASAGRARMLAPLLTAAPTRAPVLGESSPDRDGYRVGVAIDEVYDVELGRLGPLHVRKLVIPTLLPLYLDEALRYGRPIKPLDPHPFL